MAVVRVHLPDNSIKEFDHEPSVLEVAQSIGSRLARDCVGGQIDGASDIVDLRLKLKDGTKLKIVTQNSVEALEVLRHSAAHVMAQAVQELWPDVKVTIGPVVENGFYYDFDCPRPFTPEDLEKIESRMKEIIKRNLAVSREELPAPKAIETFRKLSESYKVEIIEDLGQSSVTIYRQGDWFDLCRGPHVQNLGQIGAVKVLSLAGAYWRGNESNKQLQRIYATAFQEQKDLDRHLQNLEEAKKRDHRRLGKELGLFMFSELAPGSPFFTAKGTVIYNELLNFMRSLYSKYGYQEVISPQIYDVELYRRSGHYEHYRENMYFSRVEERDFSAKPMNCPGHCLLYNADKKSYRDLPWRVADFGRLHRYERSGTMHGLTRVRSFSQDDAHIFCTMDQIQQEIEGFMHLLNEVYTTLGMKDYKIFLSTRPARRMGSDEVWDKAEGSLERALKEMKLNYKINPGDGAFYGPKLDIIFVDALDRPWQLGTLQCDFNMPAAFQLSYVGSDNAEHTPVMLHRAILGSLERFIGVYLEHTAAKLPVWLAPVQVAVFNITDDQRDYAAEVARTVETTGFRVGLDVRGEKLGFKVRQAQLEKTPYMIVVGDKERSEKTVSVRLRSGKTVGPMSLNKFIEGLTDEVANRRLASPWEESH